MRNGPRRAVRWIAVAAAALACWAPAAQAAVPGDEFAEALPLPSSLPVEATVSNEGAGSEPGENVGPFAAGHSVWFAWTASEGRWVTVGTCASAFPTVVGVFTGTELGNLTRVVEGDAAQGPHCPDQWREYTFRATAGAEYRIAVDGSSFFLPGSTPVTEGAIPLRIEATPPPANDDFADAVPISGRITEEPNGARFYFAHADGCNWGATKQAGEPDHGGDLGGASVWYAWTAPESGLASFNTFRAVSGVGASIIGVYAGSSLGSLIPVASNPSSGFAGASVTAGTTYLIAVDGRRNPETGETPGFSFQLQIGMPLAGGPGEPKRDPQPQAAASPPAKLPPRTILGKRTVRAGKRTATLRFSSSVAGGRFRCKLDRGRYLPCRSPKTYRHLAAGRHTFKAVAVDAAGLADPTPLVAHLRLPKR